MLPTHNKVKKEEAMLNARIIIGNMISLVAAVIMCFSATAKTKRRVYILQLLECLVLFAAQMVFGYRGAAIALLIAAARNIVILLDKYNLSFMLSFVFVIISSALMTVGDSAVELLPVGATLTFTVGAYIARGVRATKLVLVLMLTLWAAYSFIIRDFSTAITNSISCVLALSSLVLHARDGVGKYRKIDAENSIDA